MEESKQVQHVHGSASTQDNGTNEVCYAIPYHL